MKVVICGAGIGGLVLAHALEEHATVQILERDPAPESTGGYRISLNDEACATMRTHLPPALLDDLRSMSDTGTAFEQFTLADSRLRPLVISREDPDEDRILAQRQALRVLLAGGLTARITYGATVASVRHDRASVTLTDGTSVDGDLVVAADGASSAVVRSLLGRSPAQDLGLTGIAGSSPVPTTHLPRYLRHGPALAFGADGTGVFLSLSRPPEHPPRDPRVRALLGEPSLIWGVITRSDGIPCGTHRDPRMLVAHSTDLLRGWPSWLTESIAASDEARTAAFPLRAVDPSAPLMPWNSTHVVALGDAIHAMPPTGGRGASTAVADAGELAEAICDHLRHGVPLGAALSGYHRGLEPRARSAVRESLAPLRIIRALRHRPVRAVAGPLLTFAGRAGALRYRHRR